MDRLLKCYQQISWSNVTQMQWTNLRKLPGKTSSIQDMEYQKWARVFIHDALWQFALFKLGLCAIFEPLSLYRALRVIADLACQPATLLCIVPMRFRDSVLFTRYQCGSAIGPKTARELTSGIH